jgi:hypothetical protein
MTIDPLEIPRSCNTIAHLMCEYMSVLTHKCFPIYVWRCYFSSSFFKYKLKRNIESSDIRLFEKKERRRRIQKISVPRLLLRRREKKSEKLLLEYKEKKKERHSERLRSRSLFFFFSLFPVK